MLKIETTRSARIPWIVNLILVVILFAGATLRFYGQDWDQKYHLHPDERFLTMVETSISPTPISEYFNTSESSLNPHNRGFSFYVYGTFPLFLVRYFAGWLQQTGYDQVHLVGRSFSALFDIGTILLVFLISRLILKKPWAALAAAAFYAFAVLPIQQSHFFTVDLFGVFFTTLAFYIALRLKPLLHESGQKNEIQRINVLFWSEAIPYIFFGCAIGFAAASKINNIVFALLLPLAHTLRNPEWFKSQRESMRSVILFLVGVFIFFCIFRVAQPYAFSGPGVFGIIPNVKWLENIRELSILSSGNSNYPPSLQWARRGWTFAGKNMLIWGLGLPFGLSALLGLILMGWRILKGEWKKHFLLWIWTCGFFVWQSLAWNPTMRYLLPIYPLLAVIAGWFLEHLFNFAYADKARINVIWLKIRSFAVLLIILFSILGTGLWAVAFMRVYQQPMPRIAASEWIYKNIEGPINLHISSVGEEISQPLPYSHYYTWNGPQTIDVRFMISEENYSNGIQIEHIIEMGSSTDLSRISAQIMDKTGLIVAKGSFEDTFQSINDPRGKGYFIPFENAPVNIQPGEYRLLFVNDNKAAVLKLSAGMGLVEIQNGVERYYPIIEWAPTMKMGDAHVIEFRPIEPGKLDKITLFRALDIHRIKQIKDIEFEIMQGEQSLGTWHLQSEFNFIDDYRGGNYAIPIEQELTLEEGQTYKLILRFLSGEGEIIFNGSLAAKETDWDDALPLFMYDYNPFDYQSGVYQSDLNFDMYAADDGNKLARFERILIRADYIIMSSNRQWGSTTQIPERYPLTSAFYAGLLNCSDANSIQDCYRNAEASSEIGMLGYRLAATFQSYPGIGRYSFNSQYAEEAFTVYDHPKVLIFEKTTSFGDEQRAALETVDLNKVLNLTPAEANKRPGDLLLKGNDRNILENGGTWSALFDSSNFINSSQLISILGWYIFISLLGIIVFPITRVVFSGLHVRGYALSRILGVLLFSFGAWILGSGGFLVTKVLLWILLFGLIMINGVIAWFNRTDIHEEIKTYFKEFIRIEIVFLITFVLFLLIRLGNPDLWHPYKGGEKPMDFAYLNAVIKSDIFPPYDPWYAGGYINYYYFGFILAGIPIKALGIVPSIAYNLVLPTFFALSACAAYSVGFHLWKNKQDVRERAGVSPWMAGIITVVFVLILGNLGTIKMIFNGLVALGSGGAAPNSGVFSSLQPLGWFFQGIGKTLQGMRIAYYPGDWYWIPSRAIPGEPITEFPFFTFLYGDPHAHLFALPMTFSALCWSLSLMGNHNNGKIGWSILLKVFFGALIVGSLRAINSWDWPLQLLLGSFALIYFIIQNRTKLTGLLEWLPVDARAFSLCALLSALFIALNFVLYLPFIQNYGQAYASIALWSGSTTPIRSYLTHWGVQLFFIASWLFWSIFDWLKNTRVSEMQKWKPYSAWIFSVLVVILIISGVYLVRGVSIILIAVPLILLCGWMFIFSKRSGSDLIVAGMVILGLAMTIFVEIFVLRGDIGRMNTVFKFYLQAWSLLSFAAAYAFVSMSMKAFNAKIYKSIHSSWMAIGYLLLFFAFLYPLTATLDKITDRMNSNNSMTLDGMDYMATATYQLGDRAIHLSGDYEAIRWMQENIQGSPVIIEAQDTEYRWGSRFSIYTGLPGVVGWNWHQRQQRAINPWEWVWERVEDVKKFYETENIDEARGILNKYHVKYIVVGNLERALYPEPGLKKLSQYAGSLWESVYCSQETEIYKVIN